MGLDEEIEALRRYRVRYSIIMMIIIALNVMMTLATLIMRYGRHM